jgi:hypothetical protein
MLRPNLYDPKSNHRVCSANNNTILTRKNYKNKTIITKKNISNLIANEKSAHQGVALGGEPQSHLRTTSFSNLCNLVFFGDVWKRRKGVWGYGNNDVLAPR